MTANENPLSQCIEKQRYQTGVALEQVQRLIADLSTDLDTIRREANEYGTLRNSPMPSIYTGKVIGSMALKLTELRGRMAEFSSFAQCVAELTALSETDNP